MDQVYQHHFGFRVAPFNITPDPGFLYMTESHKEGLAQLSYGIKARKGFVVVTGEVGTGKTTLIKALLNELTESTQTALLFSLIVSPTDLLRYVCEEFGILEAHGPPTDVHEYLRRLNEFLLDRYKAGKNCALIIDEAQNLSNEVLEAIRLLSNFETSRDKLLQIVLVGQPELTVRLNSPSLRQLKQRITLRHHLRTLTLEDCRGYITNRVQLAGGDPKIFTAKAVEAVYQYSSGIPRLVNVLCDNALLTAYALGQKSIDAPIVREVAADLHLTELPETAGVSEPGVTTRGPYPFPDLNGSPRVQPEPPTGVRAQQENTEATSSLGAMKDFLRTAPEAGTVPDSVVLAIAAALTEAIGPMAPLVLRDIVSSLGESETHFPRAKLPALVDSISREIVDEGMRSDFQQTVSAIIAR
jgi:general secretion pathway protein A